MNSPVQRTTYEQESDRLLGNLQLAYEALTAAEKVLKNAEKQYEEHRTGLARPTT